MDTRFENKYCVVTGGAKGIGAAIAAAYLKGGAAGVAILDMDTETAAATARALDPDGGRTLAIRCDVGSEESVAEAFRQVFARFGRADILVNNAGFTRDGLFHKLTSEQLLSVLGVHIGGTFYCSQQVVAGMRERKWGRILNISSLSAFGNVGQANYSAAKAGVIGLTSTMALELATKNVTVNCIAPGLIQTDIIKTIPEPVLAGIVERIPMKRAGRPEDIAALAAFLSSEEANFITGQCIRCSGGA